MVRDHGEQAAFAGPRFLMRVAELDMHPLDAAADSGLDRKTTAQDEHGLGYCNITKCCTEVCPEGIKITDNALIPLRSGPPTGRHDPVVWLGNKIRRRKRVGPSPAPLVMPACQTAAHADGDPEVRGAGARQSAGHGERVSCGAGDDSENGGGRGLTAALSAVPPSAAGQVVTYTDVTAARRLVGTGRKVYRSLDGYGIIRLTGRPYTADARAALLRLRREGRGDLAPAEQWPRPAAHRRLRRGRGARPR